MNESKRKILSALGRLVKQRRTALGISPEELGLRANFRFTENFSVKQGVGYG